MGGAAFALDHDAGDAQIALVVGELNFIDSQTDVQPRLARELKQIRIVMVAVAMIVCMLMRVIRMVIGRRIVPVIRRSDECGDLFVQWRPPDSSRGGGQREGA